VVLKNENYRGFPDLTVLLPDRVYLVEVKQPRGVLSKVQVRVHKKLAELGFEVLVVRSLEEFKDEI